MNPKPVWAADDPAGNPPPDPAPNPDPASDPAPDPATTADYSFLPEQYRSDEAPDIDGFKAHYDELAAAQAQRDEAAANIPEDASGYEFALPENLDFGELNLPEDFTVNPLTDDPAMTPLFEGLGSFMHQHGLPKEAAGDLMGMIANYEATKYSQLHTAAEAEMTSLGSAAHSRIANIDRALQSRLTPDLAKALSAHTTTAKSIQALEKLLAPRSLPTPTPTPNTTDLSGLTGSARLKAINEANAAK